jgi:hypothetical protein
MQAAAKTAEGLRQQAIVSASKNPSLAVAQLAQMLAAHAGAQMFGEEAGLLSIAEEAEKSGDMLAAKRIRDAATEFRVRANSLPVLGSAEENGAALSALAKQMMDAHYPQAGRALDGFDGLDGFGSWIKKAAKSVAKTVTKVVKAAPAALVNVTTFPVQSIVRPLAWAGVGPAKDAVKKLDNMTSWMEHNPGKTLIGYAAVAAAAVGGGVLIAGATGVAAAGGAAAATTTAGAGTTAAVTTGVATAATTGVTVTGALTTAAEIAPIAMGVVKGALPSKPPPPPLPDAGIDVSVGMPTSIINPDGSVSVVVPDGKGGGKYVPFDAATGAPAVASGLNLQANWPYWAAGFAALGIVAVLLAPKKQRAAVRPVSNARGA